MKMFLFDDEESIRYTLKVFAEMLGLEVTTFSSPVFCEALMRGECGCTREHACCDLLLTDQNMPQMTGLELIQILQGQKCLLPRERIGLMSGNLSPAELALAESLGCHVFAKPVTYDHLEDWLAALPGHPA